MIFQYSDQIVLNGKIIAEQIENSLLVGTKRLDLALMYCRTTMKKDISFPLYLFDSQ